MPSADFERYRQRLEDQLRADVEMLYQAYLTKLRAYETISRPSGRLSAETLLPAELTLHLPSAPGPAPGPAASGPQAPASPPRAQAYKVEDAITAAMEKLPEVFDKFDVLRVLDFEPRPSTLHRVLRMFQNDGVLAFESRGSGRYPTRYRKLAPPEFASD
jgi:hypothetical protein